MSRILRLADVDLTKSLSREKYKKLRRANSERFLELRRDLVQMRIPLVMVFEGWDAAGKGGTIRRLMEPIDPRHFTVNAIVKPTQDELDHNYLWRFWNKLPKRGDAAIFDRSWYGRVLVERIEGFATRNEWSRAYDEINRFEQTLADDGHVVVKFFLHISKDEQKKRFDARAKNPLKSWKLNDEDYRNRKKWDDYEVAIDDMFKRTDTTQCPWHVIPANDKHYARHAVSEITLKSIAKAIERRKREA
jgi:PPK2 family polyphosphate:nucleotide phosphotransferase